jgi:hypothetical protein
MSMVRQCELAGISRSAVDYDPRGESELNLKLMRLLAEQYTKDAVLRCEENDGHAAQARLHRQSETSSATTAADGAGSDPLKPRLFGAQRQAIAFIHTGCATLSSHDRIKSGKRQGCRSRPDAKHRRAL